MVLFHYGFLLRITISSFLFPFFEFLKPSLTQIHFIAKTSLELLILLLPPPNYWDYRHVLLLCLASYVVISKAHKDRVVFKSPKHGFIGPENKACLGCHHNSVLYLYCTVAHSDASVTYFVTLTKYSALVCVCTQVYSGVSLGPA